MDFQNFMSSMGWSEANATMNANERTHTNERNNKPVETVSSNKT